MAGAPDLMKTLGKASRIEIAAAMWNHFPHMVPMMEAMKVPKTEFKQEEMADLLAYLVQAARTHY